MRSLLELVEATLESGAAEQLQSRVGWHHSGLDAGPLGRGANRDVIRYVMMMNRTTPT
jgi:hypothetical protein